MNLNKKYTFKDLFTQTAKFEKGGDLENIKKLASKENQGDVYLRSLTTLPDNVKFENQGDVYLRSLTTLPDIKHFKNTGKVVLNKKLNNTNRLIFK